MHTRKAGFVKGFDWVRDILSSDSNLFVIPERFDLAIGSILDGLGFAIEILFELGQCCQIKVLLFETSAQVCHLVSTGFASPVPEAVATVAPRIVMGASVMAAVWIRTTRVVMRAGVMTAVCVGTTEVLVTRFGRDTIVLMLLRLCRRINHSH
jgi:hypothetical protein